MIPFEATLNGVTVNKEIPTSWGEVKFKHLAAVAKNPGDTNLILSVLTDIEPETLKKAKINNLDDIILALSFFNQDIPAKIPETILGWKVPKDLGFESTAQYEDLKLHLKECRDKKITDAEMLDNYPLYCAIYVCSQRYGDYDWEKAQYLSSSFLEAPATEVLAIGNFTLLKLIGLNLGIKKGAPKPLTRTKRLRLVLKSWLMSLVLPVRLAIWKRKHLTKKANS